MKKNTTINKQEKTNAKHEKAMNIITPIVNKPELTERDKLVLVSNITVTNHTSGKLEGIQSINTSVLENTFCAACRKHGDFICTDCYAVSHQHQYTNSMLANKRNRIIWNRAIYPVEMLKVISLRPLDDIVRFDSFGDLETINQAINYLRICKAFPYKVFTLWTKHIALLRTALLIEGKPENLNIIQSSFYLNKEDKKADIADYVFTVYDKHHISDALHHSAECNGRKCAECGWKCYYKAHNAVNIAEILK